MTRSLKSLLNVGIVAAVVLLLLPACAEREPTDAMPMHDDPAILDDAAMHDDAAMTAEQVQAVPQLMPMHEAMAADDELYPHMMSAMMARPELRRMMGEAMGMEADPEQLRARMDAMALAERRRQMAQAHALMRERMEASPELHQTLTAQMMDAHRAMLDDEAMHAMMMDHPEVGPMLGEMGTHGGMMHDDDTMHDDTVHDDAR